MERVLFLKTTRLLSRLPLEDLEAVDQRLVEETFQEGEILFSEGAPGERLYFVHQGEILLLKGERKLHIDTIKVGHHCGEVVMFEDRLHGVTAVARGKTVVLSISREQYRFLINQRPELLFPLARSLASRLQRALTLATTIAP